MGDDGVFFDASVVKAGRRNFRVKGWHRRRLNSRE